MTIDRDAWLSAMREAEEADSNPHAITAAEFADAFGIHHDTARERLNHLVKLGKATKTRKRITTASEQRVKVPAYLLKQP